MSELDTVQEPFISSTHSEQIIERGPLLARAAELRDHYQQGANEAKELHEDVELLELEELVRSLEHESTVENLDALRDDGFSWSAIARILGVTPTAVRKWRRGDGVTADNHQRLAELLGFARFLHHLQPRITVAAAWLEAPAHPETTVTRLDLYRAGARSALLGVATERLGPVDVLDEFLPGWRRDHPRDDRFRLVWQEDGAPSILMQGNAE